MTRQWLEGQLEERPDWRQEERLEAEQSEQRHQERSNRHSTNSTGHISRNHGSTGYNNGPIGRHCKSSASNERMHSHPVQAVRRPRAPY